MAWKVSGGGGGTTPSVINVKTVAITTAGTVVTMPNAMPNTNYVVFYNCFNNNGTVGCEITEQTLTTFKATPIENATLQYNASAQSV